VELISVTLDVFQLLISRLNCEELVNKLAKLVTVEGIELGSEVRFVVFANK
jgi:hypothetical protein